MTVRQALPDATVPDRVGGGDSVRLRTVVGRSDGGHAVS